MRARCNRCLRSLAAMRVYRRRGETFRPGSIMPTVKRYQRGTPVLCDECWRMLAPERKREYAPHETAPFRAPGWVSRHRER